MLDEIDRAIDDLPYASVAFNAPRTLQLGESASIQLRLSPQKLISELERSITAIGEREGARIQISDSMQARLSGLGFEIQPVTHDVQPVGRRHDTTWAWEVRASKKGTQRLHLTLTATIFVRGTRAPLTVKTFDRSMGIRVSFGQRLSGFLGANWQWLWTVILFPVGAWLLRGRHNQAATPHASSADSSATNHQSQTNVKPGTEPKPQPVPGPQPNPDPAPEDEP